MINHSKLATGLFSDRLKLIVLTAVYLLIICGLIYPEVLTAQKIPKGTSGDQMVSFQPTTTFQQAIQVISLMSSQYEGKVVINPTGQKGPINVAIPPTHYRRALELLVKANGLEFVEKATYYEIRKPKPRAARKKSTPTAKAQAPMEPEGFQLDTREVEISAIFFQGDRRSIAEVGIDWSALTGTASGDSMLINAISGTSVTQELFSIAANYTGVIGKTTTSFLAVLQAFEALNIGEIIASPSIQVLDGITGRIQVGEKFSIKQKDFAGNTIENFFDVGTILEVTPEVIESQDVTFIHLSISAERSAAFPDPVSTRIAKQTAATQVLLLDGEQTVIAGLFSEETVEVRKGIPILKDLPWWVFGIKYFTGFNSTDVVKKELVIIVKAKLVPTLSDRLERRHAKMNALIDKTRTEFEENR